MKLPQWLRPINGEGLGSGRRMSQREFYLLVIGPRIVSPLCIAFLLYTTHWQVTYIRAGENIWLNAPVFLLGFGAIVLNLKSCYESWRVWTWHGELQQRMWPRTLLPEDEMARLRIGSLDFDMLKRLGIDNHPGYHGAFTRRQALGAWRNGTTVTKIVDEPGDVTPVGTEGVVLGSIYNRHVDAQHVLYFIEWRDKPKHAVAVMGWKIKGERPAP